MESTVPLVSSPTILVVEPPISIPKITSMMKITSFQRHGRLMPELIPRAAIIIGEGTDLVNGELINF